MSSGRRVGETSPSGVWRTYSRPDSSRTVVGPVGPAGGALRAVRLVCVDGHAGAGKTTLAGRLARVLGGVQIVHMDDLYEGWSGLGRVWDRLDGWVLQPLRANFPGRYRRYDWVAGEYAEWHDVPVRPALVVEGVGCADR